MSFDPAKCNSALKYVWQRWFLVPRTLLHPCWDLACPWGPINSWLNICGDCWEAGANQDRIMLGFGHSLKHYATSAMFDLGFSRATLWTRTSTRNSRGESDALTAWAHLSLQGCATLRWGGAWRSSYLLPPLLNFSSLCFAISFGCLSSLRVYEASLWKCDISI